MKVKEFKMLVHGPFATNIYLDLWNLAELRGLSLDGKEIDILKCIEKRAKTENQISERIKSSEFSNNDVRNSLHKLMNQKFVEKQDRNRGRIWFEQFWNKTIDKEKYSASSDGLFQLKIIKKFKKLKKGVSFDKTLLTNFLDRHKQWFERQSQPLKVEDSKDSYKDIGSYFFKNEIQGFVLVKFSFDIESIDIDSKDTPGVKLRFQNSTIHIFASGIGIFSTQVTVTYPDEVDITKINWEIIEEKVETQLKGLFPEKIKEHINYLSKRADENFQTIKDLFKFQDYKVAELAWIHKIYWFYKDEFFKVEDGDLRRLDWELLKHFTFILEQKLDEPLAIRDHYVFYGLKKSLVMTRTNAGNNLKLANKTGSLIEIGQYFCFGLNLLEFFLSRSVSQLLIEEPIIDQSTSSLKRKINDIQRIRTFSRRYLEQYRSGIKTIIHAGEISLVDELENAWHLQSLQDTILLKLDSLEKELLSREQALLVQKQDRFTNIVVIFTIISLASVMGTMITLSPLKDVLEGNKEFLLYRPLFFVLSSTALVILGTLYLVMKAYGWRQKLRRGSTKVAHKTRLEKVVKKRDKPDVSIPQDFR
jgi:hypothetical protein